MAISDSTSSKDVIKMNQTLTGEKYQQEIEQCVVTGKVSRFFLNIFTVGIYQLYLNNRLNKALEKQNISEIVDAVKSGAHISPSSHKIAKLVETGKIESLKFIINHTFLKKGNDLKARTNIITGIQKGMWRSQDHKVGMKAFKHFMKGRKLHYIDGFDCWGFSKRTSESAKIRQVFESYRSCNKEVLINLIQSIELFNEGTPKNDTRKSSSEYIMEDCHKQLISLIMQSKITPQERADLIEQYLSKGDKIAQADKIMSHIMAENDITLLNLLLDKKIGIDAMLTSGCIYKAIEKQHNEVILKFLEYGGVFSTMNGYLLNKFENSLQIQIALHEKPEFLSKAHQWDSSMIQRFFFKSGLIERFKYSKAVVPSLLIDRFVHEPFHFGTVNLIKQQVQLGNTEFLKRAHLWDERKFSSIFIGENLLGTLMDKKIPIPEEIVQRCLNLTQANDSGVMRLYQSLVKMADQGNTRPLEQLYVVNPAVFSKFFILALRDRDPKAAEILMEAYQKNASNKRNDSTLTMPYYTAIATGNEAMIARLTPHANPNDRLSADEIGYALGETAKNGIDESEILKKWLLPLISQKLNGQSGADKKIHRLSNIQHNAFAPLVNTPQGLKQAFIAEPKAETIKFDGFALGKEMLEGMDQLFDQ